MEMNCKIVKINNYAVFEFLQEAIITEANKFFDLLDITKVRFSGLLNQSNGDFIFAAYDYRKHFCDTNLTDLISEIPYTTNDLFTKKPYCSCIGRARKKVRYLGNDVRIIRMNKDSTFSCICKIFTDMAKTILHLNSLADVKFDFNWNVEANEFVCIVSNSMSQINILRETIDAQCITAQSLFEPHPYSDIVLNYE